MARNKADEIGGIAAAALLPPKETRVALYTLMKQRLVSVREQDRTHIWEVRRRQAEQVVLERDPHYKITYEDLLTYAEWLGMDIETVLLRDDFRNR